VAALVSPPRAAAGEWTWPVDGPVLTRYVNDDARPYAGGMHRGVDIGAKEGAAVGAAHAGDVTFAGAVGSSGMTVSILTADGRYATSYLHLARIDVARGASVGAGDRIGLVGTTGRRSLSEPHLHFGVRVAGTDDRYVDPLSLLPALGGGRAVSPPRAAAPAPLRAQPEPKPVPASVPARPVSVARPDVRGTLRPLPVPTAALRDRPARAPARTTPLHRPDHRPRTVPAGPIAKPSEAAARSAPRPEAAPVSTPVRDSSPLGWGRPLFVAGVLLALAAVLVRRVGRPGWPPGVVRRLRADRRRHGAHDAADAKAPDPVTVPVPQMQ
jgi:hypothetical protein